MLSAKWCPFSSSSSHYFHGTPHLQDALYDYLKERNIDDDMAAFICMYADQKEQTEYTKWLQDLAKFIK